MRGATGRASPSSACVLGRAFLVLACSSPLHRSTNSNYRRHISKHGWHSLSIGAATVDLREVVAPASDYHLVRLDVRSHQLPKIARQIINAERAPGRRMHANFVGSVRGIDP